MQEVSKTTGEVLYNKLLKDRWCQYSIEKELNRNNVRSLVGKY